MENTYLVWSHEHGAWWGPGQHGYTPRFEEAGHYSRHDAMMICVRARGGWRRGDPPPEIPVRLVDQQEVEELAERFSNELRAERQSR